MKIPKIKTSNTMLIAIAVIVVLLILFGLVAAGVIKISAGPTVVCRDVTETYTELVIVDTNTQTKNYFFSPNQEHTFEFTLEDVGVDEEFSREYEITTTPLNSRYQVTTDSLMKLEDIMRPGKWSVSGKLTIKNLEDQQVQIKVDYTINTLKNETKTRTIQVCE